MNIELKNNDKIAAAFEHKGEIIIITEYGDIYHLNIGNWDDPSSHKLHKV